jgi:tRNA threonylcarbamoyladenosine biosynthesis protein TsaE
VVAGCHVVLCSRGVRLDRLERIAGRLARALQPGDLVLLYGPLGAGKTTFVRAVAAALDVTDPVRSPSFTIANIYAGPIPVQHLDLYRLDEMGDDDALALEDYVDGGAVTLVEWPEAGAERLGAPAWTVRIGHESPHARTVEVEALTTERAQRWEDAGDNG